MFPYKSILLWSVNYTEHFSQGRTEMFIGEIGTGQDRSGKSNVNTVDIINVQNAQINI